MKMTTGYEFQGYVIVDYIDVLFDEILVGIGFGKAISVTLDNIISSIGGVEATEMIDKLNSVKQTLRNAVEEKATKMGANALIGVDFESSKLGDLIMVSMTATAVKIEKLADYDPITEEGLVRRQNAERIQREQEEQANERERQLQKVMQSLEGDDLGLASFLVECGTCTRFLEIKKLWESSGLSKDAPIFCEIYNELDKKAAFERMYGGTTEEKVLEFVQYVKGILEKTFRQ